MSDRKYPIQLLRLTNKHTGLEHFRIFIPHLEISICSEEGDINNEAIKNLEQAAMDLVSKHLAR